MRDAGPFSFDHPARRHACLFALYLNHKVENIIEIVKVFHIPMFETLKPPHSISGEYLLWYNSELQSLF